MVRAVVFGAVFLVTGTAWAEAPPRADGEAFRLNDVVDPYEAPVVRDIVDPYEVPALRPLQPTPRSYAELCRRYCQSSRPSQAERVWREHERVYETKSNADLRWAGAALLAGCALGTSAFFLSSEQFDSTEAYLGTSLLLGTGLTVGFVLLMTEDSVELKFAGKPKSAF